MPTKIKLAKEKGGKLATENGHDMGKYVWLGDEERAAVSTCKKCPAFVTVNLDGTPVISGSAIDARCGEVSNVRIVPVEEILSDPMQRLDAEHYVRGEGCNSMTVGISSWKPEVGDKITLEGEPMEVTAVCADNVTVRKDEPKPPVKIAPGPAPRNRHERRKAAAIARRKAV